MKKARRFLPTHRLPILVSLIVALATVGLTAFAASAGADFNIEAGTLLLKNGTTTGVPPSGSWVELLNKDPGGLPFNNEASTAADHFLTLINGNASGAGLTFGEAQPTGGIFGPLTDFGGPEDAFLFSALTLPGSKPLLKFSGIDTETIPRALLGGNLLGLDILYTGNHYNVQTEFNTIKDTFRALRGLIVGNLLSPTKPATILLSWAQGLLEEGFSLYNALFQWIGTYDLP